jgi:hypothetical protein
MFIKEQQADPKMIAALKIRDPEAAQGILYSLRALLLKKKI